MAEVLEAHLQIDIAGRLAVILHQSPGFLQSSLRKPPLRCVVEDGRKVVLETCQRPSGEMCELLHGEVAAEVVLHEVVQVYLVRRGKVEEHRRESRTELQQHENSLSELAVHELLGRIAVGVEILHERLEEALQERMARQHEDILVGCTAVGLRGYHDAAVVLQPSQEVSVQMEEDAVEGLASSRPLLFVHAMVAPQEAGVAFSQVHHTFGCLHVHLSRNEVKEGMLLHHLLAELVFPHMTEEERIHIAAHAGVILEVHVTEKIDCHCKCSENLPTAHLGGRKV